MANKRRIAYHVSMDEGRKRVLLIAASYLGCQKTVELRRREEGSRNRRGDFGCSAVGRRTTEGD
jgi:hypothetical protein